MTHPEGRDAETGQFVTEQFADEHPETTEVEEVPDSNCGVVPVVIHPERG